MSGRLCVICPLVPIQSPFLSFQPPLTPWLSHRCWNTSGLLLPQGPCTGCFFCRKCFPKYPQGFFPSPLGLLPHLCSKATEPFIYACPPLFHSQVNFPRSILSFIILTRFYYTIQLAYSLIVSLPTTIKLHECMDLGFLTSTTA